MYMGIDPAPQRHLSRVMLSDYRVAYAIDSVCRDAKSISSGGELSAMQTPLDAPKARRCLNA